MTDSRRGSLSRFYDMYCLYKNNGCKGEGYAKKDKKGETNYIEVLEYHKEKPVCQYYSETGHHCTHPKFPKERAKK